MPDPDNLPDDVLPEAEGLYSEDSSVEGVMYQAELSRRMDEQMQLRALCIENGDNAEKFLRSPFGQYILGQAELEAEQAKESLADVDPDDKKEINRLQNIIKRSRTLEGWISSAIEKGNAEYAEYLQEQAGGV